MRDSDSQQRPQEPKEKDLKLFSVITGVFVAVLILSAVTSSKIFSLGPLALPGGTVLFPIVFIFNDILTEVYGYARSRRVIWTGLACQVLATLTYLLVGALPPASFWPHQEAYQAILGFVPRIAIAGIISYFCGEFANSFILSRMKYLERGERGLKQGWRFIASTIVGEGVDSVVIMVIAFGGVLSTPNLIRTLITLYVVKVVYEIVALPFSMRFANWVKRVEGVDKINVPERTNYNPFGIFSRSTGT